MERNVTRANRKYTQRTVKTNGRKESMTLKLHLLNIDMYFEN